MLFANLMRWLATASAILGGLALLAVTLITGISVGMRNTGFQPIPGDTELVEAGIAFAVFAFIPICQINRAHADVALVTNLFPPRLNAVIDLMGDLLMAAVLGLLLWRHVVGMLDKRLYLETTWILQFPVWWAYAACLLGGTVAMIVALWCVGQSAVKVGRAA